MKQLPIGISDFKTVIEDYFYIDKTLLIDDLMTASKAVILTTRPRRFGKTLNLSMLKYFFEKREESYAYLFFETDIWRKPEYHALQGQYPVIFLSFKDCKQATYSKALENLSLIIGTEFNRHKFLLQHDLVEEYERKRFRAYLELTASEVQLGNSLLFLSELLTRAYGKKCIILIDEYDTPILEAHLHGYYEPMIYLVRSILTAALKDNSYLYRGFLTGILRTAKEGIFSGLNNISAFSLLSPHAADKFGFTEVEVDSLLNEAHLDNKKHDIKEWYNSYRCGSLTLYNPWSILNCITESGALQPYWVNTSDNALVTDLIASADNESKKELEALLSGKEVEKEIQEACTFPDVDHDSVHLWSLLLFTGYITFSKHEIIGGKNYCSLKIPNKEIQLIYHNLIQSIFSKSLPTLTSSSN